VRVDRSNLIMHTVNAVGGEIDARTAQALLSNLADAEVLSPAGARILGAAVTDRALMSAPPECRDKLRAGILKQCLLKALQP
jgi:transcriptional regulator CtsR